MKRGFFKSIISLAAAVSLTSALWTGFAAPSPQADFDGYIVKLKENAEMPVFAMDDNSMISEKDKLFTVDSLSEADAIDENDIEYIEPNYIVELFSAPAVPDDPNYNIQWNMHDTDAYYAYQQGLTGKGIKVGFVDSGINGAHEDFEGLALTGKNFISSGSYDTDNFGHGTFSGSIVAAQTNNGKGLIGVAPGIEYHAYRVFDGKSSTIGLVVQGINQAAADGCQIINLSLGTSAVSSPLRDAVKAASDAGIIVVCAVGNSATEEIKYPAGYDNVIGVGSVDRDKNRSYFSQYNSTVDFTAPGGGVAGLGKDSPTDYRLDMESIDNRGTSFAAPIVTGMAALALEYENSLSADTVYRLLELSSSDRGAPGRDDEYGHGIVNVGRFVDVLMSDYTIKYVTGTASLPSDAALKYNVKTKPALPVLSDIEGYTFAGWYGNEKCTGTALTSVPSDSAGDITFYAGFKAHGGTEIIPASDIEAADGVMRKIRNIGTVNYASGYRIKAAEDAYAALTESQKALVSNADVMTQARADYDALMKNKVTLTGAAESISFPGSHVFATLYDYRNITCDSVMADENGVFTFADLKPGNYKLVVSRQGHLDFTVTDIETSDADIDLRTHENPAIRLISLASGDVNGDKKINEGDVSAVRFPENINKTAAEAANALADVNGDGKVNEGDVSAIRFPDRINKTSDDFKASFLKAE